jgi:hypothetical protein
MPSHIYSMVGLWEESIAANLSALDVRNDYFHASDFIVYAQLQLAQDARRAPRSSGPGRSSRRARRD